MANKYLEFRRKLRTRIIKIVLLLLSVLLYGTLGFYIIEGASLFDAFYMAVITVTTVGFSEVIPLSLEGRLFAVTSIFAGLVGSGISIALISNLIFEETLMDIFKGRKVMKQLANLRDHFIICGCGSTGRSIIEELVAQKETVVVIDQNPVDHDILDECIVIRGDARKNEILEKARIEKAKGLASTLTEDADNVFVTLSARDLNPQIKIVSRFKDDDTEKKLAVAGVDQAVSPYRMGGQRLALALTNPAFQQIIDASFKASTLDVRFAHVHIPPDSFLNGKKLKDSQIRKYSLGALVVAVVEKKGNTLFNPSPDLLMDEVDQLLILGDDQQIKALKSYLKDASGES